jgi:hypothetical protein
MRSTYFEPLMIEYSRAKNITPSTSEQADTMYQKFLQSNKGIAQPVGITYSANYDQTRALAVHYNTPSNNSKLLDDNWKNVVASFAASSGSSLC